MERDSPTDQPGRWADSSVLKSFAFWRSLSHSAGVTQPLALLYYKNLLPGSQLVNRLQDLGYRVHAFHEVAEMTSLAQEKTPLVLLADLTVHTVEVCAALSRLRQEPTTNHLPVLAYTSLQDEKTMAEAHAAGATLVASEVALMAHLPQLLDQVLQVE